MQLDYETDIDPESELGNVHVAVEANDDGIWFSLTFNEERFDGMPDAMITLGVRLMGADIVATLDRGEEGKEVSESRVLARYVDNGNGWEVTE